MKPEGIAMLCRVEVHLIDWWAEASCEPPDVQEMTSLAEAIKITYRLKRGYPPVQAHYQIPFDQRQNFDYILGRYTLGEE